MSKQKVYTVNARRFGSNEAHSYLIGVYPKKHQAQNAARVEEEWRGGKYECEIIEWLLGEGIEGRQENEVHRKIIGNDR